MSRFGDLDRSRSVHAERLKQQGRLFPLFIFEMLPSARRPRVSGIAHDCSNRCRNNPQTLPGGIAIISENTLHSSRTANERTRQKRIRP
jgi:hypothetical protein